MTLHQLQLEWIFLAQHLARAAFLIVNVFVFKWIFYTNKYHIYKYIIHLISLLRVVSRNDTYTNLELEWIYLAQSL